MGHNEPNPVCLTTGHKDTPPIWKDRTLHLYGLIKEISQKLQLFSQDSTAPTHILGTPPLLLRHNEPNPVSSTTGHTPTNGLNLAQLSNTSAFRYVNGTRSHTPIPLYSCSIQYCISACMGEKLCESPLSWSKQQDVLYYIEKQQCAFI